MSIRLTFLAMAAFTLALASFGVAAQCATGVDTGGGNCVPPDAAGMPGYNPSVAPAPPGPSWESTWGAIALDTEDNAKGDTTGASSKSAASDEALSDCSRGGARHCRIIFTYSNQCASVAWGDHAFGVSAGTTIDDAQRNAVTECAKGSPGCKPVYQACSPARKISN